MAHILKQSQTAEPLLFLMTQSADHITGLTGASPTVTLSKNGAAFGAAAGAVSELANGWYKVAGNATDTNTLGPLLLHATATSGDPVDIEFQVVGYDPESATVALSAADSPNQHSGTAQAGAASTITLAAGASAVDQTYRGETLKITAGTGAGQSRMVQNYVGSTKVVTVNRVWATNPDATSVYAILATDVPKVDASLQVTAVLDAPNSLNLNSGTAQAGGTNTITLVSTSSATDNLYVGLEVKIYQGTGAGQVRRITGYVGSTKVATVDWAWATAPDGTSLYALMPILAPAVNSSLQEVAASVAGAVGSVTGAVGSVTGNVGGSVASVTADVGITQVGADKVWSTTTRALTDKAGFALSAAGVQAIWDALTSALTTAGSIGKWLLDKLDTTVGSRMATFTLPANFSSLALDSSGRVTPIPLESFIQHNGTAQAGTATSLTLAAGASAVDDFYKGSPIKLYGGTGAGEIRVCSGYTGSTKVATFNTAWPTTPDATSQYAVLAMRVPSLDAALQVTAASVTGAVGSVTAPVTLSAADSPNQHSGTAQAGADQSITLTAGASATDQTYRGETLKITAGTGAGQSRMIQAYIGSTKVATVNRSWATIPDATSVYTILATDVPKVDASLQVTATLDVPESLNLNSGIAQGGGSNSITLVSVSSAVDNFYVGLQVKIYQGTGVGQVRRIVSYVGSTKVATVDFAWAVSPDSASFYALMPIVAPAVNSSLQTVAASVVGAVGSVAADVGITQAAADKVWTSATRTLTSVGTLVADVATAVWAAAGRTLTAFGFNPTVGGYAAGQDPATLLLVTPANKLATDASNRVTVGTNADKTGYALTSGEHTAIAGDTQTGLTAQHYTAARGDALDELLAANIPADVDSLVATGAAIKAKTDTLPADPASNTEVDTRLATIGYTAPPTVGAIDTQLTGSHGAGTWQQGNTVAPDNADIALIRAKTDNLPADPASNTEVDTRLATGAYTTPPTPAANATATWADAATYADGTKGAELAAVGAPTDPWATDLPGAYVAPQAGYLIGRRLDVAVSTRAIAGSITQTAPIGASGLLVIHVGADYGPTPAGLQRFLWLADPGTQPDATGGAFEVAIGGLAGSPFTGAVVIASPSGPQLFEGLFTHVQTAGWVTGTYHFRAVLLPQGGSRSIVAEGLLEVRPGL